MKYSILLTLQNKDDVDDFMDHISLKGYDPLSLSDEDLIIGDNNLAAIVLAFFIEDDIEDIKEFYNKFYDIIHGFGLKYYSLVIKSGDYLLWGASNIVIGVAKQKTYFN